MTEKLHRRIATDEEILSYRLFRDDRVRYRHGVRENHNPRARNGVSHREHTSAKLRDVDGVPNVICRGAMERVTATHITFPSGYTIVTDLRIRGAAYDQAGRFLR